MNLEKRFGENAVQIALKINDAKKQYRTINATAKAMNISSASVSRYLKILTLSEADQKKILEGTKPVRERKLKRKVRVELNKSLDEMIDCLAHSLFALVTQLSQYLNISESKARRILDELKARGLVTKKDEYQPYVYALSTKGCVYADINKPKHFMSGAAIHQRLLRNDIELEMKKKNNSVHFLGRPKCWSMGLFPTVAEHVATYTFEEKRGLALVVIDDYCIAPSRLIQILNRQHDKKKAVVKGKKILKWKNVIDLFIVYCTTEKQKNNHIKYVSENKKDFSILPVIREIKPIWEVF